MPNNQEVVQEPEVKNKVVSESETTVHMLLQKMVGGNNFTPTEKQVDEILAQKSKIIDYVHRDKQRSSYDSKFYLIVVLIFVLIFSGLVIYFKPDLFSQVLSFLTGIFGGGLGGYGFGKLKD
jgi:cytochrome c1